MVLQAERADFIGTLAEPGVQKCANNNWYINLWDNEKRF